MKMPLSSSQTIAVVAIAIALAAGAYALGRATTPSTALPTEVADIKTQPLEKAADERLPVQVAATNPAPPQMCSECLRVVSVHSEAHKGKGSGLGAVGGALIGGLLGNQVGGGTGKKIATVGGAVAGGMAGNEIERRNKSERVWIVRMVDRDGTSRSHQQDHDPELREGDVVALNNGQLQRR